MKFKASKKQIEQLKPSHISSELITIRAKTITGMILSISIRPTDTVLKLKQYKFNFVANTTLTV
jgi:hypothetical protein